MRLVRGRAVDPAADRDLTRALLADAGERGEHALRAWTPHRQVAFGRRDASEPGYEQAVEIAESRGYPAIERSVGGRAVAYTGATLAFAWCRPVTDARSGLGERYDEGVALVVDALDRLGVDARPGEPPDSFCPGQHSVQADGKVAGIAQRVTQDAALVAGVVVVADVEEFVAVLDHVYEALGVPFDPESVGSVVGAGGPSDPGEVGQALEESVVERVGAGESEVVSVDDLNSDRENV